MIKFCAQVNEWEIKELEVWEDHVHLLIQANADDSPASIMQLIKGGTSKKLREMFPGLAEVTWSKSFWADGYFAETVGEKNMAKVAAYIKSHNRRYGKEPG